jgi:hypothetical protein
MCRYMFDRYRTHWICVADRRCFKATWQAPICPDCGHPMIDVGKDFHAPRRVNPTQWRKIAMLVEEGLLFHSCGCTGPGPRPQTLSDAKTRFGRRRSGRRPHTESPHYRGRRPLLA